VRMLSFLFRHPRLLLVVVIGFFLFVIFDPLHLEATP
jgi:hypothetical protein